MCKTYEFLGFIATSRTRWNCTLFLNTV